MTKANQTLWGSLSLFAALFLLIAISNVQGASAAISESQSNQTTDSIIYLVPGANLTIDGLYRRSNDVHSYDTATGNWSFVIDASDLGIGTIDAVQVMDNGTIYLSVNGSPDLTAQGIGVVTDHDILKFTPTSLGSNTAGTLELYFDGSDVELTGGGEVIESFSVLSNGDLIMGATHQLIAGGVNVTSSSLARFSPTSTGDVTSGTWSVYLDGTDVIDNASAYEGVYGVYIDEQANGLEDVYLTFKKDVMVNGTSVPKGNIIKCEPTSLGAVTNCVTSVYWDGSIHGLAGNKLNGLSIEFTATGPTPTTGATNTPTPVVTNTSTPTSTPNTPTATTLPPTSTPNTPTATTLPLTSTPTNTPIPNGCGGLEQEAESGIITGPKFQIGNGLGASGGQYIHVPDENGIKDAPSGSDASLNNNYVSYCFTVPATGDYQIEGWVAYAGSSKGNSDSFFVQIDNLPSDGYLWQTGGNTTNSSFVSDWVADRGVVDPVVINLTAGDHTIKVHLREDGTLLDKLILVPQFVLPPTPTPPVGSTATSTQVPTTVPTSTPENTPSPTATILPPTATPINTPIPNGCGGLEQEAESGIITGSKFEVGNGLGASGGQYIHVPEANGTNDAPSGTDAFLNNNYVSYCFTAPATGDYQIEGWVAYASGSSKGNSDSFFVQVDNAPSDGYLWQTGGNTTDNSFVSDWVADRGVFDPVVINLTAGDHMIKVHLREDGTLLDKLVLVPQFVLPPTPTPSPTPDNNIDSGLIMHYPMHGGLNDISGNDFQATINIEPGYTYYGALSLIGINDYVRTPIDLSNLVNTGDPIHLALWFKAAANGTIQIILGGDINEGSDFEAIINPDGTLTTRLYGGASADSDVVVGDSQWHHISWGTDGTSTYFYVDGVLQSAAPTIGSYNRDAIVFGGRPAGSNPSYFYNGLIDDVRIYDRALNQAEIGQLTLTNPVPTEVGVDFDCALENQVSVEECEAVLAIYEHYDFSAWAPFSSVFYVSNSICEMNNSIACTNGHVSALGFYFQEVASISPRIGDLTFLTSLGIENNSALTSIPTNIDNLLELDYLQIEDNSISELPFALEWSNFSKLEVLRLSRNNLVEIPQGLGDLAALEELDLNDNLISNSIPTELEQLAELRYLDIADNPYLYGAIPDNFTNLSHLNVFLFNHTQVCTPPQTSTDPIRTWLNAGGQWAILKESGVICGDPAWNEVVTVTQPDVTDGYAMAFDSTRDIVVLYGGGKTWPYNNQTWEFNGTDWTQIATTAEPNALYGMTLVYDDIRNKVVLFGGSNDQDTALNETWEYNGGTWLQVSPASSPPARTNHAAVWDSANNRMLIHGGNERANALNDLWVFNGTEWAEMTTINSPVARTNHAIAYHNGGISNQKLLLYGGRAADGTLFNETAVSNIAHSTPAWAISSGSSPGGRQKQALVYWPDKGGFILIGGTASDTESYARLAWKHASSNTWNSLAEGPAVMSGRQAVAVYNSDEGSIVMFVGTETWILK